MKKEAKFWKRGLKVLLAIGLFASMLVPTTTMAYGFVTPGDGEVDDIERRDVAVYFFGLFDNGVTKNIQIIEKEKVELGTTFKEAGIQFPTVTYKNLTFLGWVDRYGNDVDENTVINYMNAYSYLYPKFDKVIVPVTFRYPNTSNELITETKTYILEHGATFQDLSNQAVEYRAENISKEDKFSGWSIDNSIDMNEAINATGDGMWLHSEFENKNVLCMSYSYYDTKGVGQFVSMARFVEKHTRFEDITGDIYKLPLPESFKGLRTNGWEKTDETGIIENFDQIRMRPNYENYIVRFMIDDMFKDRDVHARGAAAGFDETEVDTIYAFVAEKGDIVSVPEIKEYTNIKWIYTQPEGDNLKINGHTMFLGYGDKVDVPTVNPDDGDTNEPTVPEVTLPEEEINNAVNEVENASKGDKVTVDMKDNVTLPVEVLESARGKDVEVVFNMGAYSWSINGLDITAETLKAINLEVKLDADAISADVVKTLAGDRPTMQLSLSHNGEFGFKAKLQFNIGVEHKGKYGNLYYYNEKGKLVFMNADKIDADGNVSLEFDHASDYVVVIDEKSMAVEKENPIQETSSSASSNTTVAMLMLLVLAGTCYLVNKKAKLDLK